MMRTGSQIARRKSAKMRTQQQQRAAGLEGTNRSIHKWSSSLAAKMLVPASVAAAAAALRASGGAPTTLAFHGTRGLPSSRSVVGGARPFASSALLPPLRDAPPEAAYLESAPAASDVAPYADGRIDLLAVPSELRRRDGDGDGGGDGDGAPESGADSAAAAAPPSERVVVAAPPSSSPAAASTSMDRLDPASIDIVPRCDSLVLDGDGDDDDDADGGRQCLAVEGGAARTRYPFVSMIRGSAPYIADHRGGVAVFHIPGELLEWDGLTDLMDDIALIWLLGVKIVIVAGCRLQVDDRMARKFLEFDRSERGHVRRTDDETLRVVEEEAGYVRFELERQLNRCLRLHGGGCDARSSDGPPAPNGNVVSGNFFSAQPFGVVGGVDYLRTGYPGHVNSKKIRSTVDNGDVVLLTPIGVSPSGDVLNVNSESLAAFVAGSLRANKVVYCSARGVVLRNRHTKRNVQNFRLRDAAAILERFGLRVHPNFFVTLDNNRGGGGGGDGDGDGDDADAALSPPEADMLLKIGWAARALRDGVERAHIVAPADGALLEELYTARGGTGTCISRDAYESAHPDDDSGDLDNADWSHPQNLVQHFSSESFDSFDLMAGDRADWGEHAQRVVPRDYPWG